MSKNTKKDTVKKSINSWDKKMKEIHKAIRTLADIDIDKMLSFCNSTVAFLKAIEKKTPFVDKMIVKFEKDLIVLVGVHSFLKLLNQKAREHYEARKHQESTHNDNIKIIDVGPDLGEAITKALDAIKARLREKEKGKLDDPPKRE